MLLVLAGCLAAGCAAPAHFGRWHVATDLAERTGNELGPENSSCHVSIPEMVAWEDGLSEDEAVALGLWSNPAYQELLADLHITRADLIEAHQLANPEISTMFPVGVKQWEFALTLPLDVLVLRPHRVAAVQLESNRVAERLVQDGLDTIRDVRVAYADLVLADGLAQLAEQGSELRRQIAKIAEARLRAGAVAELDVSAVRLDALFGEEAVVRATRDAELTREQLRYVLGIELTDIEVEPAGMIEVPTTEFDVDELVSEALASRPDLRALNLALGAALERARLTRFDYLNIWGVLPDINSDGEKGFEAGPGLRFTVPILNQNQGATARASADVERIRRKCVKLQDQIGLEVRQAHTNLRRAKQDLHICREQIVPQAELAVTSARKALQEDVVPLLLVLETTRQQIAARQRELEAAAEVHRAIAELERSVGRRLIDERLAGDTVEEVEQ